MTGKIQQLETEIESLIGNNPKKLAIWHQIKSQMTDFKADKAEAFLRGILKGYQEPQEPK